VSRHDRLLRKKGRSGKARPFLSLDRDMLNSAEWISLPPRAVKLLIDLASQYNGSNNGDLSASWRLMKARGWSSPCTLAAALRDLIGGNWLELTRQGGLHAGPHLYALTFRKIDECKRKLEVQPTIVPSHAWRKTNCPVQKAKQAATEPVPRPRLIGGWEGPSDTEPVSLEAA
jgi:hypothetical protein